MRHCYDAVSEIYSKLERFHRKLINVVMNFCNSSHHPASYASDLQNLWFLVLQAPPRMSFITTQAWHFDGNTIVLREDVKAYRFFLPANRHEFNCCLKIWTLSIRLWLSESVAEALMNATSTWYLPSQCPVLVLCSVWLTFVSSLSAKYIQMDVDETVTVKERPILRLFWSSDKWEFPGEIRLALGWRKQTFQFIFPVSFCT